MMKKTTIPPQSRLHFEKVPLAEVAKKIAPDSAGKGRNRETEDLAAEVRPRPRPRAHFHGVQFYDDPGALCRIVGSFVGEGLEQGTLAVLIATPEHGAQIESCLRSRGIDVEDVKGRHRLVVLDAHETLQLFMMDGMPNPGAFRRVMTSLFTQIRCEREQYAVRAYGEMVDLLWKDGLEPAAIRLETLWNQLATTYDFKLLCGYSMGNFYKGAAIEDIHDQHTHVIASNGDPTECRDPHAESATRA